MIDNAHSVTSNTSKLLKHLDKLKSLQDGYPKPIMVHCIPTHRCQLDCVHCCFKNRDDKTADMEFRVFKEAIFQFNQLGVRALEFTGGGDPTLWPYLGVAVDYLKQKDWHVGIITNGIETKRWVKSMWDSFDWVRISFNTLEYRDTIDIDFFKSIKAKISACYIWHSKILRGYRALPYEENLKKAIRFADKHEIVLRIAPDCIQLSRDIVDEIKWLKFLINVKFKNQDVKSDYIFLSDFNIHTVRRNNRCYIHLIKPCLYLDGWVYACPSAELAVENDRQVQEKARICKYDEIYSFYRDEEAMKPRQLDCSYCKYVKQQELLEDLLTETEFNEFA